MVEELTHLETLSQTLLSWLEEADARAAGRPAADGATLTPDLLDTINGHLEACVAERTGMLRVLHDVTAIVNEARTIESAFRQVLKRIAEHNGWSFGHVYLVSARHADLLIRTRAYFEDNPGRYVDFVRACRPRTLRRGAGLPGRVLASGEADWITDLRQELPDPADPAPLANVRTAAAFPVKIENDVLAVFEFLSDQELAPDKRVLDSMAGIGTHLGLFIVRKRMKRRIAALTTLEQQRIGRDLHDDLGQQLTGVAMLAKGLERDLRDAGSAHAERATEIARGLKEALMHVRLLARGLVPVELDGKGLMKALADLARDSTRRFEIDVRFAPVVDALVEDGETATQLYRIAQEAVTNAAKHGKATAISIGLSVEGENIALEIRDNGVGVSEATIQRLGVGMSTMVYRANIAGGDLTIERGPTGGTIVRCSVSPDTDAPGVE